MEYRILPGEEWGKLAEVFASQGHMEAMPDPMMATAAVAEEDGVIVGVLVLQLQMHMEPIIISPKYRSKVRFPRLVKTIDDMLSISGNPVHYYAFSPNKKVGRMCQISGMNQVPYRVWHKGLNNGDGADKGGS